MKKTITTYNTDVVKHVIKLINRISDDFIETNVTPEKISVVWATSDMPIFSVTFKDIQTVRRSELIDFIDVTTVIDTCTIDDKTTVGEYALANLEHMISVITSYISKYMTKEIYEATLYYVPFKYR